MTARRIVIVGGGASGALVAIQLLRLARRPVEISIVEPRGEIGRGAAYGTTCREHLLNVPAGRMSALPDEPGHFLAWARVRDGGVDGTSFVARAAYGQYIGELLGESERVAQAVGRLVRVQDRVVSLEDGSEVLLRLESGGVLRADRVVLALGNFPPAAIAVAESGLGDDPRYIRNPWTGRALPPIDRESSVMLIGSGLTAVDMIAELDAAGHRGTVTAVSRHGLVPAEHKDVGASGIDVGIRAGMGLGESLRRIREACGSHPWRQVIDGMRAETPAIWQAWSEWERRQFVRHVRQYWDVHRHRIAPEVAVVVERLRGAGRLSVVAGTLLNFRRSGDSIEAVVRRRGSGETLELRAAFVLNCTGPDCDYGRISDPLVRSMLLQGLAQPDGLRLGLQTGGCGALVGANGITSARMFVVGPPRKPRFWETTAVPEIRVHARELAERLLADV